VSRVAQVTTTPVVVTAVLKRSLVLTFPAPAPHHTAIVIVVLNSLVLPKLHVRVFHRDTSRLTPARFLQYAHPVSTTSVIVRSVPQVISVAVVTTELAASLVHTGHQPVLTTREERSLVPTGFRPLLSPFHAHLKVTNGIWAQHLALSVSLATLAPSLHLVAIR
jgi:hypothetical protein